MEPDESAVQTDTQTDGTLSIKQFNTYEDDGNGKKSVEVKNGTELNFAFKQSNRKNYRMLRLI